MKKISFRAAAIILLLFNGISAILGGLGLIIDPSGNLIQLPIELLKHTPFKDYLIPGILLFFLNGLFDIAAAVAAIKKAKYYQYFIFAAGLILVDWVAVQILMIKVFYMQLHMPLFIIGVMLMAFGALIHKQLTVEKKW